MPITKPELPAKRGYVEVVVDGVHKYKNAITGILMEDEKPEEEKEYATYGELAEAIKKGVNSVGE